MPGDISLNTDDGSPAIVIFDFDGTLAEQRGSWGLLYRLFGVEKSGERRTKAYWDGELTFAEWCNGNIADWREHNVQKRHLERAAAAIKLTTGAETLLHYLDTQDIPFGVLSSGVSTLVARISEFDPEFIHSNEVVFNDDGEPIDVRANVGPDDKGHRLLHLCDELEIEPEEVVYVGDSHSDVEAFEVAGTTILFDPDDRIDEEAYGLVDHIEHKRDLQELIAHIE